jgi:hypothetical protein
MRGPPEDAEMIRAGEATLLRIFLISRSTMAENIGTFKAQALRGMA